VPTRTVILEENTRCDEGSHLPAFSSGGGTLYFNHHVFMCTNERQAPDACCAQQRSVALHAYAKERIKALGLNGQGRIRINKAGCLDRCGQGPCLVVYPEGVWYTFVDESDIDEIIQEHLMNGRIVQRLVLPS
jgi:(2Fe-2S) ferredoxin